MSTKHFQNGKCVLKLLGHVCVFLKPFKLAFLSYLPAYLKPCGHGYSRCLNKRCLFWGQESCRVTLWPVFSNVFSMQGEARPTVEGTQLGLEQGPGRKTPPLLIEATQISLSDLVPCFFSKLRGEGLLQTSNVSNGHGSYPKWIIWGIMGGFFVLFFKI